MSTHVRSSIYIHFNHSLFLVSGNVLDIEFSDRYVPIPSDPDSDPEIPPEELSRGLSKRR